MKYFYYKNKSLFGPLPLEDLVKVITSKTLVKDDKNEWKLAIEYPEIASKMELLNVYPEQIVIPPLPTKRGTVQPKPNDKDSYSTNPKFPPPLKKSDEPKNTDNKKTNSTNNNDHKSTPPKLPLAPSRPQNASKTQLSPNSRTANTVITQTGNNGKGKLFLFVIGIAAALIAIISIRNGSGNDIPLDRGHTFHYSDDDSEENDVGSPEPEAQSTPEPEPYAYDESNNYQQSGNSEENTEDKVNVVTNGLIGGFLLTPKETKICFRNGCTNTISWGNGWTHQYSESYNGNCHTLNGLRGEYCSQPCCEKEN